MKEALLAKIESCIKLNTAASYEIEYSCIIPYNPPPPIKNRALASLRMACYYLCHARIQRGGGGRGSGQSCQASIQCWSTNGSLAKCHLMAFRWLGDGGPLIVVFGSYLPSPNKKSPPPQKKKVVRVRPPSDKTFWIRACLLFILHENIYPGADTSIPLSAQSN